MSAVTPDLYRPMYSEKVTQFFANLLDAKNAGKPLMRPYLEAYWDLYWDLHLGIKGDAVPQQIRQVGNSFNTVLAYRNPTQKIVYENYMTVRSNLAFLKAWIDQKLDDLNSGRTPAPEKTFAYYWLKNGGDSEDFKRQDVVFECFHNFVAFSQWGNTLYNIMLKLSRNQGDPDAQDWFRKTMEGSPDDARGAPFPPLERFVMELFRVISPNGGSISALEEMRTPPFARHGYIVTPHTSTSLDPLHWQNPQKFDPSRYNAVPTSHDIDEAKSKQMGFAKCPFDRKEFEVKDGRKVTLNNSAFGTVYGVASGKPMPVCDYAGFAPFGFGYRRCPGEQLTIQVFEDFLRKVWKDKIEFVKLNIANPQARADRSHHGDRRQCRLFAIKLRAGKRKVALESPPPANGAARPGTQCRRCRRRRAQTRARRRRGEGHAPTLIPTRTAGRRSRGGSAFPRARCCGA